MKKAVKTLGIVVISAVILSCRNNSGNNPAEGTKDTVANAAPSAAQVVEQSETQQIDTLAVFDTINGMLKSLKGEQLWSKKIFTPAYYEVCQKLNEFSDGDSLWELGSIQEVMSVELTDVTEFKMLDPTHAEAEAMLECKDIDSENKGTEFRTLSLVLEGGAWLIDDVAGSKQDKIQAVAEHEASSK